MKRIPTKASGVTGLVLLIAWTVPAGRAQDSQPQCESPGRAERGGHHGPPGHGGGWRGRGPDSRPLEGGLGLGLGRRLFEPAPEDQGKLREGEADELLAFAKEHLPRLYDALAELKQRNPARFEQQMSQQAPRLRHLKRIFGYSPKIGELLQSHAETMVKIRRQVETLQREPAHSAVYDSALQSLRELVAENVRIELGALRDLATQMQEHREKWVAERAAYFLQDDADLSVLPEKLRDDVAACRAATEDGARTALRERITQALGQQLDKEIEAMRARAADMETNTAREVDARVERFREMSQEPGRHGRGGPHGAEEKP